MDIPNRHVREVVKKVSAIGWEPQRYDGQGHIVMRHLPSGIEHSIQATPSEYRGMKNCIAMLERLAGEKLPRANANKAKRKTNVDVVGFSTTHTTDAQRAARERNEVNVHRVQLRVEVLEAERKTRILEFRVLSMMGKHASNQDINEAKQLIVRIAAIERVLDELGQTYEIFNPLRKQ